MRYTATFESDHPTRGVVVDESGNRFARFPTTKSAKEVAEKLNAQELELDLPQLARVLVWRSISTGERLDLEDLA